MKKDSINNLRQVSRKVVRELGMLQLNEGNIKETPQHWHALIEIAKEPNITISKLGHLLLLSVSSTSRIINKLLKEKYVVVKDGVDKREKYLHITENGKAKVKSIDEFSNTKIKGAFELLTVEDQNQIVDAIRKYGEALEKSRLLREQVKIHTMSTSRAIRKQIINMIENIQKNEYSLPITDEINIGILKAEEEFYYNNTCNFWYAVDNHGAIIGSIALKKIDDRYGEVKKFFVEQKYRGKGVAQKLMSTLVESAIRHQFNYLVLGTVGTLQAAQKFYKKCGFTLIKKQQLPSRFEACPLDTVFYKAKTEVVNSHIKQF